MFKFISIMYSDQSRAKISNLRLVFLFFKDFDTLDSANASNIRESHTCEKLPLSTSLTVHFDLWFSFACSSGHRFLNFCVQYKCCTAKQDSQTVYGSWIVLLCSTG